MPYTVLMPIFARRRSARRAAYAGIPDGGVGRRSAGGAVVAGDAQERAWTGQGIAIATAMFGAGLIVFGLSQLAVAFHVRAAVVTGFGMMQQMAASNTILQTIVDEDKRGRVMSFYSMAFLGMAPFGSLLAGWMAARIGAPRTVMICGMLCIVGAGIFLTQLGSIRKMVRPIYVRLGILPEVAAGIQQASNLQATMEQ